MKRCQNSHHRPFFKISELLHVHLAHSCTGHVSEPRNNTKSRLNTTNGRCSYLSGTRLVVRGLAGSFALLRFPASPWGVRGTRRRSAAISRAGVEVQVKGARRPGISCRDAAATGWGGLLSHSLKLAVERHSLSSPDSDKDPVLNLNSGEPKCKLLWHCRLQ